MLLETLIAITALGAVVKADRPANVTICDYYTPLLLGEPNSAASQQKLMQRLTHTFILGNYTTPNVGIKVAGIAAPANFSGHEVNLLNYFTGAYYSTNGYNNASTGVAKNFLDDGGATALLADKPADKPADTNSSNQYALLTHVYQYFGEFYGCSEQGTAGFPKYKGVASMYEVHKFMKSDPFESGYFNEQIVLAAKSLGFEEADCDFTQKALDATFGNRCSPAAPVIPASAGPQLQAICVSENCPLDPNATCSAYPDNGTVPFPAIANATLAGTVVKENDTSDTGAAASPSGSGSATGGSGSSTGSSTGSDSAATATGGASTLGLNAAWQLVATLVTVVGAGLFVVPL